jgi:hypothetical protein
MIVRNRTIAAALLAVVLCRTAMSQAASAEKEQIVSRVKNWAVEYTNRLQDFLCTQSMTRYKGKTGPSPGWERLEHQQLDVSYKDKKVGYRRLSVDGRTDRIEQRVKKGYLIPGGEFGAISWPFLPKSAAEFALDHREVVGGQTVCVLSYIVPSGRTNIVMGVNGASVPLAYHGVIEAVCDTGEIHRLEIVTDIGKGPGRVNGTRLVNVGMELDIRYAPYSIAGVSYLLPSHAILKGLFHTTLTRADIDFDNYRKYEVNSNISFDDVR